MTWVRRVGQAMVRGETGFVEFVGLRDTKPYWLAYAPVPGTGWSLSVMFPQDQDAEHELHVGKTDSGLFEYWTFLFAGFLNPPPPAP